MLALLPQPVRRVFVWRSLNWLFPFCVLLPAGFLLHDYFKDSLPVLLAGMAAMISTTVKTPVRNSFRFAIAAAILLVFTWLVPVNTLLYLTIGLLLFYWTETQGYRLQVLGVTALFLSSPAFQYAAGAFSFPIRMHLASLVAAIFSRFTASVEISGNTIFYDGHEFAVDPACMGLHMLSLSLLLGIFLLGMMQKKAGKQVSPLMSILFLCALLLLNLVANVLRILLLVQFAIPPAAVMHDIIGLLCLLLYVCVPACALAKRMVLKAKTTPPQNTVAKGANKILPWLLLAGLVFVAQRLKAVDTYEIFHQQYIQTVPGYTASLHAPGIVKLQNEKALIYVKFIRGFYDTEHNPSMCWRGSGYDFTHVKTRIIGGNKVYTARLCNKQETLYTAWWFGNNHHATTSQWQWRWAMIKGSEAYAVINVTAATESALTEEVEKIFAKQKLKPLLQR